MNKDLIAIFEYLEKEKGIKREIVVHAIEESLQAAALKSVKGAANVLVRINPKTAEIEVYSEKMIVAQVKNTAQEISLADAQELDPDCEEGQFIDILVTPKDFGRIAAQKARQVITQKLRMAEREVIYEEYRHRVHELVTGTVKRYFRGANLVIDLGKVEGLMPMREYPKTEKYQIGEKVLALILAVQDTESGGAEVILSRSSPEFVRQLFLQEVPEISDGIIQVERIVREAGYRTKMAVRSTDLKVDPVGACVGMRGNRVKNIVRELNNEKIDIIPFSEEPVDLLQNALSPIEIRKINVNEDDRVISIVVEDDDFAAVIGKKGMNIRLNGHLIGYELEAQRMTDYNRAMEIQRVELLTSSEDPSLDEPLTEIEGVHSLIFEQLISGGYTTPRSLLEAKPQDLVSLGISMEMSDKILEQIWKKRT